jgi:hypothetical protein
MLAMPTFVYMLFTAVSFDVLRAWNNKKVRTFAPSVHPQHPGLKNYVVQCGTHRSNVYRHGT